MEYNHNLFSIGFGYNIVAEDVLAIVASNSAPMKRLKETAREENRLIDATRGRKARSMLVLKTNHIVLSAIQSETISQRFMLLKAKK